MPFDMSRYATPAPGPNYGQNRQQLQSMGFQVPRYGTPQSQGPQPAAGGQPYFFSHSAADTQAASGLLAKQGFQMAPQESPKPAPRSGGIPVPQVVQSLNHQFGRPPTQREITAAVNEQVSRPTGPPRHQVSSAQQAVPMYQDQLARAKPGSQQAATLQNAIGHAMDTLNSAAPHNKNNAQAAQWRNQYQDWQSSQGAPAKDVSTPGFPDPEGTGRPFDKYWGYGDQATYEANGAPKSYRPGQANSVQQSSGTPYGVRETSGASERGKPLSGVQAYAGQETPSGSWRPAYRVPGSPYVFTPDGSNKPDYSYGYKPSQFSMPYQPGQTGQGGNSGGQQAYPGGSGGAAPTPAGGTAYSPMGKPPTGNPRIDGMRDIMAQRQQALASGGTWNPNTGVIDQLPQALGQYAPPSMYGDPLQQAYQQNVIAGPKQGLLQWGQQAQAMPWDPNYGNSPFGRPDPYSINVQGPFGNNLNDMWSNMGGFVQGVNNQAAQQPVGTYLGAGNPGANYAKMNYDIPGLLSQGQQMVQNGWQNPFMYG